MIRRRGQQSSPGIWANGFAGASAAASLVLALGCAGAGRHVATEPGADAENAPSSNKAPPKRAGAASAEPEEVASEKGSNTPSAEAKAANEPPPAPAYDQTLVRAAIDRTAAAPDERGRLGLRLAIVDQGPDAPWLVAIVNRGTEPVRVLPDLRTLSLEISAPKSDEPPPKTAWHKPAPKPTLCTLPRGIFPSEEDGTLETALEPGEGVVDSFDPRLYCLPTAGKSPLVPGASVTARLGWPDKTKTVWEKGKRTQRLLEQSAPFVARRAMPAGSLPALSPPPSTAKVEKSNDSASEFPKSDAEAVKQLVSTSITLGSEYQTKKPEASVEPLELVLTRGSDASTERDATISVSLVNHSKKAERLFFRREYISYEISGPAGLVACEPGPDNRAPDRLSMTTLRPGGRISAVSRLIELCPQDAMRRPGLYLVQGRYDGVSNPDPQAPATFAGRVTSHEPVVIRVRSGWGDLPAQREPLRVRVGTP